MAIKNTLLGGTDWVNGEVLEADDLNDTIDAASTILGGYDATGGSHTNSNTTETEVAATAAILEGKTAYVIKAMFTIVRTATYTANTTATVRLKRGTTFGGSSTFKTETIKLIPILAGSVTYYASEQNSQTVMYVETTGGNYSGTEKVYASVEFSDAAATNVTCYCKWIEVVGYGYSG